MEEEINYCNVFITCLTMSENEYEDIEEFINEYNTLKEEMLDKVDEAYKEKCEFNVGIELTYDGDYSSIELNLKRTRTKEEMQEIVNKKLEDKQKIELKEAQLMLAQEEPEYNEYLKLKEKYKHIE